MNELSRQLKNANIKTMAMVSELAMHQALAMSMYQEKTEKESLLCEGNSKLADGEISIEEVEMEYLRSERRRIATQKDQLTRRTKNIISGGVLME